MLYQKAIPVRGFAAGTPKLKPPAVVVAKGYPVAVVMVDALEGSKVSPDTPGTGVTLLARAKFGRLDTVDNGVAVATVLPPRPKPAPGVIVVEVPKVKLVIP